MRLMFSSSAICSSNPPTPSASGHALYDGRYAGDVTHLKSVGGVCMVFTLSVGSFRCRARYVISASQLPHRCLPPGLLWSPRHVEQIHHLVQVFRISPRASTDTFLRQVAFGHRRRYFLQYHAPAAGKVVVIRFTRCRSGLSGTAHIRHVILLPNLPSIARFTRHALPLNLRYIQESWLMFSFSSPSS